MAFLLGTAPILNARVCHPATSAASAVVETSAPALTGAQVLHLPGLSQQCYVVWSGITGGRAQHQLVAGFGGLLRDVPGQHFRLASVREVITHLLAAAGAGETLAPDSEVAVLDQQLPSWQSPGGRLGLALDALTRAVGTAWSITPAGAVRLGMPTWAASSPDHVLTLPEPGADALVVAFQDAALLPGTTFRGRKVVAVDHHVTGSSWRSVVRQQQGGTGHPLDEVLRSLVEHFRPQLGALPVTATVVAQGADGRVDVLYEDPRLNLGDGPQSVEVALVGPFAVKVAPGAPCVVEYLNGDLARPIVRQYLPGTTFTEFTATATSSAKILAPAVDVGAGGAVVKLAGGSNPVIRSADVPGTSLLSAAPGAPVTGTYSAVTPGTVLA